MRKISYVAIADIFGLLFVGFAIFIFGTAFSKPELQVDLVWKGCYSLQSGLYAFFVTKKFNITCFLIGFGACTSMKAIITADVGYAVSIVAADLTICILVFILNKSCDLIWKKLVDLLSR